MLATVNAACLLRVEAPFPTLAAVYDLELRL
ncbi:MAG: hypothetical protein ACI8WY_004295 [Planctomycetota bacterium]|jgi:hypothetical protein